MWRLLRSLCLGLLVASAVWPALSTADVAPAGSLADRMQALQVRAPLALGARYGCVLQELSGGELGTVHLLVSSRSAFPAARRLVADVGGGTGVRIGLTTRHHRYRSEQSVMRAITAAGLTGPEVQASPEVFPLSFRQCPPIVLAVPAENADLMARAQAIEQRFGADRVRVAPVIFVPGAQLFGLATRRALR